MSKNNPTFTRTSLRKVRKLLRLFFFETDCTYSNGHMKGYFAVCLLYAQVPIAAGTGSQTLRRSSVEAAAW